MCETYPIEHSNLRHGPCILLYTMMRETRIVLRRLIVHQTNCNCTNGLLMIIYPRLEPFHNHSFIALKQLLAIILKTVMVIPVIKEALPYLRSGSSAYSIVLEVQTQRYNQESLEAMIRFCFEVSTNFLYSLPFQLLFPRLLQSQLRL